MTDTEATATATAPPGGTATATSSEPVAVQKVVEHGEASDLPELDWAWRRAFVFALTATCCAGVWWLTRNVTDVDTLRMTIRYLCWTIILLCMLYIAGASSEKIVQLVSAVRTTRRESITTAPPAAVAAPVPPIAPTGEGELPPSERVRL